MKRFGHQWEEDSGGYWSTTIDGKFKLRTWQFGKRCNQMSIEVLDSPARLINARVLLDCLPTRNEAMKTMVKWVEDYKKGGLISAEESIRRSFLEWPDLYRYRYQVLNQMFFPSGNAYDWVDGQLIGGSTDLALYPWDDDEALERSRLHRRKFEESTRSIYRSTIEGLLAQDPDGNSELVSEAISNLERWEEEDRLREEEINTPRPLEDDGRPVSFSPLDERFSNISFVPDDVTDEWLLVAIEAAEMLLERQSPECAHGVGFPTRNREIIKGVLPRLHKMRKERGL